MLLTGTWNLSNNGNTLIDDYTEVAQDGSRSTVRYLYERKEGNSGFVGTWVSTSETLKAELEAFVLQVRPYEGDGLSFINTSEERTKSMKFDGKDYPTVGPKVPKGRASSMRRVNPEILEVTDKNNGKVTGAEEIKLSPDLKTLTMTVHAPGRIEPDIFVFERQ